MSNFHDPLKHLKFLRQSLSQDKKPTGFFISAGCPLAVEMPKDQWPLIPDVKKLTQHLHDNLKSKAGEAQNKYDCLIEELDKAGKNVDNIEDILSFLRALKQVCVGNTVRGFDEGDLVKLEKDICEGIVNKLDVMLPNQQTPYHKLARWISSIDREKPIELFTTNYDLLTEQSLEEISVPYFDGFVGSRQSFFDLRALEDNLIPKHWTRLWKIHGSINWFQKNTREVYRSSQTAVSADSHLIYPSHIKYEQSRKMPYLALIDQLTRFLRQANSILILSGYSFNDEHLNDTIINALKANPNTMVIALLFGNLKNGDGNENYPNAIPLGLNRSNLAIWGRDEAIIGTVRGRWRITKDISEDEDNLGNCLSFEEQKILDADGKDTGNSIFHHYVELGDFKVFGNYLQALIGFNEEEGNEK